MLLTHGNFGRKADTEAKDGGKVRSVIYIVKKQGLFSFYQEIGLGTWELCQKHPWLKPFAFLYGMARHFRRGVKALFHSGSVSGTMKNEVSEAKYRYKLYQKLGIKKGK